MKQPTAHRNSQDKLHLLGWINELPPQFINYEILPRPDGGTDKVPLIGPNGHRLNAHDPSNWMDYQTAVQRGRVAFVLTKDDPFFFFDLDKCRTEKGEWSAEATAIFTSFRGALGEISSSGKGLHVLGKCRPDMLEHKRRKWAGWLEFYTDGRYVAFGDEGWSPIGGSLNLSIDWTAHLEKIVPDRPLEGDLPAGADPRYTGPENDDELIAKMLASKGSAAARFGMKATVSQLWSADPALCQIFPSNNGGDGTTFNASDADAALMSHLAYWTGRDMARMDRLFRRSALVRDKYLKREDYRTATIQGAARLCKNVYDHEPKAKTSTTPTTHEGYLTIPEMVEHFKGCVYIVDAHKVLVPGGHLLKPEQFNALFGGHQFQMSADNTKPDTRAFMAFTENRAHIFPKVMRAVFDPNRPPGEIMEDTVNTFFNIEIDMTPGDVGPFIELLEKLLPDQRDRTILTSYLAAVVQFPGKKFRWAPVLQGEEGNGKTMIANFVAYAVGEKYTHRPNSQNITEKFNSYVAKSLFAVVEEIDDQGKREVLDALKPLVANDWIEIRGMRVEKYMVRNFCNWFFLTNHQDAIRKRKGDRRFCMLFTDQQSFDDIERAGMLGDYFVNLYQWAENGGYSAVAHYLKTYAIPDEFNPATFCNRAPMTTSTTTAIERSRGLIESEVIEATKNGTRGFRGGFISMWALDVLLKDKGLRIGRNKRAAMLENLGYFRHPYLIEGRTAHRLAMEGDRQVIIFVHRDVNLDSEYPEKQYCEAQGYLPT